MKKFKLVKTAAALALGASVVTSAVVPGAMDASAASKYKVSNGKLLNAKTGKAVNGYVVYKSKLYYNGKLKQGYKTVGTGKSIKLYYNGSLKKGYKTARDNKLLFFNGSLKKGYSANGERLYKDGFLNKGYKVYGDVAKSPVLYYNGELKSGYKTANNATLLFYNGKLKSGYKTAKGDTVLYKDGRLTKGLVEFNGKFYNDSKLANGEVDGTFYKDGKAVVALEGVKAINNTTVEVTFKNAQVAQDIKASRFAIEGLEVKNAAVKQTNDKVVLLTTSAQEAGKTYTLSVDGVKAKSFTAVSTVVPTAVELSTPTLQGVLGKEVTVTSKVTVPDGQSKAGIAVTFNVAADNTFNKDKVIEAFTDENGVAKISYTQYSKGQDTVYAYPTGAANVKTTVGKVYWGNTERLSVIDVTAGTSLANQSKKVYKVTSEENAGKTINVTFKENVNVTPDKLVRTVKVVDATNYSSSDKVPYQVTTGGFEYVQIKLDSKGEATFTVQGSNATVTPIVFADGSTDAYDKAAVNNKLEATELQAQASSVTFDKIFSQGLKVEAVGTQNAAYDKSSTASDADDVNSGGREYTATITDKDGKLAPAGTKAYVTFKKGDVSAYGDVRVNGQTVTSATDEVLLTVGKDGKVTFKVTGAKDAYVAPTVFIENGTTSVELDDADLSFTAEKTYFIAPVVKDATLTVDDADKKVKTNATAKFTYQSVDQNGFDYASDYNSGKYQVSFEVSAKFADVTVTGTGISTTTVKAGTTGTVTVPANAQGEAFINVTSADAADVTVNASASQASLPNKSESIEFVKDSTTIVPADVLAAINAAVNEDAIKTALSSVDNYKNLSASAKDYVVSNILTERKANKTVSSVYVAKLIDEATSYAASFKALDDAATAIGTSVLLPFGSADNITTVKAALDGKVDTSKVTLTVAAAAAPGTYTVKISDKAGLVADKTVTVTSSVSTDDVVGNAKTAIGTTLTLAYGKTNNEAAVKAALEAKTGVDTSKVTLNVVETTTAGTYTVVITNKNNSTDVARVSLVVTVDNPVATAKTAIDKPLVLPALSTNNEATVKAALEATTGVDTTKVTLTVTQTATAGTYTVVITNKVDATDKATADILVTVAP
ncbi:S-layer homology domain-containing protein [Rummeliibacillus sp. NPDC094406]|uniref:S-layer homology domain-containing protein n=1 Tax=Rummeliibacillus sp. NPDC094406 TaxID=3364511 RepID=UPI003800C045